MNYDKLKTYAYRRKSKYPSLICRDCAIEYDGIDLNYRHVYYYVSECGWCKKEKEVTLPKNWGFPKPPKEDENE